MSIMDFFRMAAPEAPQPTLEAQLAEREAELLTELHSLDAALAELHQMARDFLREHGAIVEGRSAWRSDDVTDRARLDAEFRSLGRSADKILARRNVVLHEWATLKMRREQEERNGHSAD